MLYYVCYVTSESTGWFALELENGIDSVDTLRMVERKVQDYHNIRGKVVITNWQPFDNQTGGKDGTDPQPA